jgi:hypothetical protein
MQEALRQWEEVLAECPGDRKAARHLLEDGGRITT